MISFPLIQISVFGELLKFWPEFQKFTSSVQEEQLLPLLHEKRVQYRARQRRWRRKEEEEEEKMRRAQVSFKDVTNLCSDVKVYDADVSKV